MTVSVTIADHDLSFACEPGETILDAAERAGYVMPYSCRKGVCQSCKCAMLSGQATVSPSGAQRNAGDAILVCVTTPTSDVEIRAARIEQRQTPARVRIDATTYRLEALSPHVLRLHLRLPIGVRVPFVAGQYVVVEFGDGERRNYSIANAPERNDEIVLHVRRIARGAFSDGVLSHLSPGDPIRLELPFGLFGWTDFTDRPAILLATGTGFAPLNSMMEDLIRKGIRRPVHLFWGGEQTQDIYAAELLAQWESAHSWFRFTSVLANPDSEWTGARGFVQDEVIRTYQDLSDHEVYACGNPLMIEAANIALVSKCGLDPLSFHSDSFVASAGDPRHKNIILTNTAAAPTDQNYCKI